jgi:hypothetical protein
MTKVHKIDLSTINAGNPLATAIDKKYTDFPDLAGFPLVSTYKTTAANSTGQSTEYLVLIFQKL